MRRCLPRFKIETDVEWKANRIDPCYCLPKERDTERDQPSIERSIERDCFSLVFQRHWPISVSRVALLLQPVVLAGLWKEPIWCHALMLAISSEKDHRDNPEPSKGCQ